MATESNELFLAVEAGDLEKASAIIGENGSVLDQSPGLATTWLSLAVKSGNRELVQLLLQYGIDVNSGAERQEKTSGLTAAIHKNKFEIAKDLLKHGANPNLGRPMISAMSSSLKPESQLKFVKLLVEHGAEVNRLYDLFGNKDRSFSALDFCKSSEVSEYLKSIGAKSSTELKST